MAWAVQEKHPQDRPFEEWKEAIGWSFRTAHKQEHRAAPEGPKGTEPDRPVCRLAGVESSLPEEGSMLNCRGASLTSSVFRARRLITGYRYSMPNAAGEGPPAFRLQNAVKSPEVSL